MDQDGVCSRVWTVRHDRIFSIAAMAPAALDILAVTGLAFGVLRHDLRPIVPEILQIFGQGRIASSRGDRESNPVWRTTPLALPPSPITNPAAAVVEVHAPPE